MQTQNFTNRVFQVATFIPWLFYVTALVSTLCKVTNGSLFWPSYLSSLVLYVGGIQGIWAAIGHLIFPIRTAAKIGWQPCGFQTEVGATNLAIGITSICSFFYITWITPIALTLAVFYTGCIYAHIYDHIKNKNSAALNTGPMLYSTMITVISLFTALFFTSL